MLYQLVVYTSSSCICVITAAALNNLSIAVLA